MNKNVKILLKVVMTLIYSLMIIAMFFVTMYLFFEKTEVIAYMLFYVAGGIIIYALQVAEKHI